MYDKGVTECVEIQMIRKFFKNLSWYCGGPIPERLLISEKNVNLLKNIELLDAIDITHAALSRVRSLARTKYDKRIGQRLIPGILNAAQNRNIPKNHIPGILLMYLELCEKCDWRDLMTDDYKFNSSNKVGT